MQFTRTNIITEGGTGKSLSSGGIVLEGNQGGGGGEYIHPTGWLWGNRYTGRETLDGDLTSNGTIYSQNVSSVNINATNITSVNGDFTNLTSVNLTSENGDFRYLNVYDNLYAWGADIDHATIRELFVSGSAHFVELIIDKINSTNGSLILSPAHAELTRVEEVNGDVYCYFPASDGDKEISNDFDIDDLVICESFNAVEGVSHDVDNKFIWKRVIGKGTTDNGDSESESDTDGFKKEHYIIVKASSFSDDEYVASGTNTEFERGDVICTLGNWTKPSRQKAILMTSTNPKFLDIGTSNPDPNKPYDVTVWGDEAYMRTAPIGVCNDVCTYDDLNNKIIRDVYPLVWSNFTNDYYRDAFTNNLQDLKTGHKITLKIRPHFDTTHYDINKYDNDCYKDDDVNNLIIFKMQSFGILRQFVLHKSSTEWWGEYKYILVKFTLYDDRIWNKCYKVRDLNLTDNEVTTIVITDADNTYGEEISKFKIAKHQNFDDLWEMCNYIVGSIGNPFSFNTGEPGYGEYYKNNCVYLNNEVYDYYNYKFLNPDNIVLASYKVTDLSVGDEAYKYQEEVIPNGNFNDNRHWLTTFSNAPEGYSDFINAKECVYMRRPLCKEVYVYGSTQMGGMSGNYLKSDDFTFPYNRAIYELSFDYYVGNDNSVNDEQFYFQFTIHDVIGEQSQNRIICPDKVGYHKCRIYLSVYPKETTLYDSSYIPNVINLHYDGIVDDNDRVEKLPYYISFNTDVCGNQNQLVIDNVHLRAVQSNFIVIRNELTNAYTYDSTTERRYRGGSVNPIEAPAIITFNNINEFSLADKHVSVLSPTFNLISASSISGLDDITSSISSLNTRVTNCETNITTNSQQIALKADKTTVNTLSGEVTNLSSAYTQTAEQVAINVSSISELNGAVTSLNSSITVLSDRITLNSSAITSLNGSVSTLESEFSVIPGQISSIVSSISSLEGEDVRLWSSISQLPTEISAYVYNEIDGDLTQTGIDITNHQISLTADNFIVKNNNNNPTLYLNSQGLVESRLGFITNPRTGSEETFNPTFYALSMERFNNDPLRYAFGLNGYNKAYQNEPVINQNPDYTDSVLIDHFKFSTDVYNRTSDLGVRIPILTMNQDEVALYDESSNYYEKGILRDRFTLKLQPKEIAITWHGGQGTPQLGTVRDLEGNQVPGVEGWIGGNDKIISIGPGGCYLKDAISTVIYTGQDSFEEWIRTHGTDTTWTNIPSGAMVRVKHYAGDSYSQVIIKD